MSLQSIGHEPVRKVFEPAFLSPIRSNQPFRTVFDRFQRDQVGCLLVTHPATGKLQGVYTSRDVLRKLSEHPIPGDADAQVHDYMRTHPDTLTLDDPFVEVGWMKGTCRKPRVSIIHPTSTNGSSSVSVSGCVRR